ncbi:MAG: hypothetical protein EBZ29_12520 [Synechococcaceae bacterium WB9_4xC_028]|nr:hypothetical protein [Synechococcaceae bacterium WB9_4xC_028]
MKIEMGLHPEVLKTRRRRLVRDQCEERLYLRLSTEDDHSIWRGSERHAVKAHSLLAGSKDELGERCCRVTCRL